MDNEKDNLKEVVVGIDNLNRNIIFENSLLTNDGLLNLMYNVLTSEAILTKAGLNFLNDHWSYEKIADIIFDYEKEGGDFKINFKTKERLVEWLENYPCYV